MHTAKSLLPRIHAIHPSSPGGIPFSWLAVRTFVGYVPGRTKSSSGLLWPEFEGFALQFSESACAGAWWL